MITTGHMHVSHSDGLSIAVVLMVVTVWALTVVTVHTVMDSQDLQAQLLPLRGVATEEMGHCPLSPL